MFPPPSCDPSATSPASFHHTGRKERMGPVSAGLFGQLGDLGQAAQQLVCEMRVMMVIVLHRVLQVPVAGLSALPGAVLGPCCPQGGYSVRGLGLQAPPYLFPRLPAEAFAQAPVSSIRFAHLQHPPVRPLLLCSSGYRPGNRWREAQRGNRRRLLPSCRPEVVAALLTRTL